MIRSPAAVASERLSTQAGQGDAERPDWDGAKVSYERMLDKGHRPSEEEILATLGHSAPWLDLRRFIEDNYDFEPELAFFGKKYGWTIRYRLSGKTLCSLFPESGAFSALIVLGRKQAEKALSMLEQFTPGTRAVLEGTEQLHDGRWLWIRVTDQAGANDIKEFLSVKRRPRIHKPQGSSQ